MFGNNLYDSNVVLIAIYHFVESYNIIFVVEQYGNLSLKRAGCQNRIWLHEEYTFFFIFLKEYTLLMRVHEIEESNDCFNRYKT